MPRAKKPMKRSRLKPVSDKRKKEAAIYAKKRSEFLALHRHCECCPTRNAYEYGFNGLKNRFWMAQDVHHTKGRTGKNFLDEETWLAVCRTCHDWIHANPNTARALDSFSYVQGNIKKMRLLAPKNM
jgi:hypothetical protein